MFNLAYEKGLIKIAQAFTFLSRQQNLEIEQELTKMMREGLPLPKIIGEYKPFVDDLERKVDVGEINAEQALSLIENKLNDLRSGISGESVLERRPEPTTEVSEPVEVSTDVWQGRTISQSTDPEFNQKLAQYKDIPIVSRRSGRKPAGYKEIDTFTDYSPQSQVYMKRLEDNPELLDQITRRVSKGDLDLASDAVSNAIRSAFSPKFTVASYPSGGAIVQEMQDRHDGRVEFLLSNNEMLQAFNNEFKQTGGDLIRALEDIGISPESNLYKSNKAYTAVAKELLLHPNSGLDRFINNLIQEGNPAIDKWLTIKSLAEQKGLIAKAKEGESLVGKGREGKEYAKEGKKPSFEDGKYLTQEEITQFRQSASEIAKVEFEKVKKVSGYVIEHMKNIGTGQVHPTTLQTREEGANLKYQPEKLRKADVMQYLINVYEHRLDSVIKNGYFTVKPIIGGYIMEFKNTKDVGPGFLNIKLGEAAGEGSIEMNFSKLITNFGVIGRQDKEEATQRVIDHFYKIVDEKAEKAKKAKEMYGMYPTEAIAEKLDLSPEQVEYYLTTAEQDFATEYQVPTFEKYQEVKEQQSRLKMILLKDINGYYQKNGKLPSIDELKDRVIKLGKDRGFIGSLTDKQILEMINKFKFYRRKNYSLEQIQADNDVDPNLLQEEYKKKFRTDTRRKRVTGDDLRPEVANWGKLLLTKMKSGDIDQGAINSFFRVFPLHSKLTKGKSFAPRVIPLLAARYGTFDNLPDDIKNFLLSKGIESLELPERFKLSKSEQMIINAFYRAENKLRKLWNLKNGMTKIAGFNSKNIDERIDAVIDKAIEEIDLYGSWND